MKRRIVCFILIVLAVLLLMPDMPAKAETESAKAPMIVRVRTDGAVVFVVCDTPAEAYCITTKPVIPPADHTDWRPMHGLTFSAFKSDGTYYVRVRGGNGAVSDPKRIVVRSDFRYVLEAEGQGHLMQPIGEFLEANGDSIEAFNERIAESAIRGGLYTRAGVANVSMRFMSDMAAHDMTLSYQPRGDFSLEENWGVSPSWGTKMQREEKDACGVYRHYGMNCGTILIWAYKQAGLNIGKAGGRRGIYDSGMRHYKDDNKKKLNNGDTCDFIATKTGHTMMILDRVDTDEDGLSDSYLVLEMESPYLKLKLRSLYSVRLCTLYDMSAVFDDTGLFRQYTRDYTGSYLIKKRLFPEYYGFVPDPWDEEPEEETTPVEQ